MKKPIRIISVFLAFLILFSALPASAAADASRSSAEALYKLGLVQGYAAADGGVNFALEDSLTRAQAMALVVRFLGAEVEALEGSFAHPFSDVPAWAAPYVGYVYTNGIAQGIDKTRFGTDAGITEAAFLTSILRVLGYEDANDGGGDFVWSDPFTLAKTAGLTENSAPGAAFCRGDAFQICYRALTAAPKSGDRLCDRLVQAGAVDAQAMAAVLAETSAGGLRIGGAPITEYTIVVGAGANAIETIAARDLADAVKEAYGTELPVIDDSAPAAANEIVIGDTTRAISRKAGSLTGTEAALLIEGTSVCLRGASNTVLRRLCQYFAEEYIEGKVGIDLTDEDSKMRDFIQNPLRTATPGGDPCIIYDHETAYYYAVYSSPKNDRVTLYRAKTLAELRTAEGKDVYVASDTGEIKHKLYAPEIVKVDGKWYIYASGATDLSEKGSGKPAKSIRLFCLEAVGDDPYGDYIFKGFLNDTLWAIDAHVFTYQGENYVTCARILNGNVITIARLENPWTIDPKRISVLSSATFDFETKDGKVNEGPYTFEHDGRLFLVYSANNVTSPYYCLGLLEFTGTDILSKASWTKYDKVMFTAGNNVYAPGHCSVFLSPDGAEYWLAYHARTTEKGERYLHVQKFGFDESGMPVFGEPVSQYESRFAPSGE